MNQTYNWKRFWYKPEDTMVLDDSGFLFDPELKNKYFKTTTAVSFDQIDNIQCLILLGEPGIGKSMTLQSEFKSLKERSKYKYLVYKDLNEYSDENRLINEIFRSIEINDWLKSEDELIIFLDSYDECLLEIKKLTSIIKVQLKQFEDLSARISLRIACRTGYWTDSLTSFFELYFGEDKVAIYVLAPLRKKEVEIAVQLSGITTESFFSEVIKKSVQPLAINPLTLEFLLQDYKLNNQFPSTRAELFHNGCKILCTEPNYDRTLTYSSTHNSPERRIALASRIAAILIFCNKSYVDLNNPGITEENAITLDILLEGEEIADNFTFNFTQNDLKETIIQTALFSSRGNLRFGFSHLAYAEYLAAKFIANHHLEIEQIKSLITISSDSEGKIIPQVKGVASWLSHLSENMTDYAINNDPQNLLYGDIDFLDNLKKVRLVESLLNKFNENSIDDMDWGLRTYYKKLNHPNLLNQLKPYIENQKTYFLARRSAIDIAEECELTGLNDVFLKIALDKSDDITTRSNVIHALIKLGSEENKKRLIPLAIEPQEEDDNDEIKGNTLRALWPDLLTTKEIFKILTPPKRSNYSGSYVFFLYFLEGEITISDIEEGLKWVLDYCSGSKDKHYEFEELEKIIIYSSWNNFYSIENLELFIDVLLERMNNYETIFPLPGRFSTEWPQLIIDGQKRLDVLIKIVQKIDVEKIHLMHSNSELIKDLDFENILNLLLKEDNSEVKSKLAKILNYFWLTSAKEIDQLLTNIKDHPELEKEFRSSIESVELDSPEAKKLKDLWLDQIKWKKKAEERKRNEETVKNNVYNKIIRNIEEFEKNKSISSWYQLFMDLTLTESSLRYGDEFKSDVTTLPGWDIINEPVKQRIIGLAKIYIEIFDENKTEWFGSNTFYRPAAAGYKSLILLQKFDPSFIEKLRNDFWKKWVYILLDFPESYGISGSDKTYQKIIETAYKQIPDEIIEVLIAIIENRNKEDNPHLFILYKVDGCMDTKMQDALLKKVEDGTLKPLAQNYIYNFLLEKGNPKAFKSVKKAIKENSGLLRIELAKSLASFCNHDDWDFIMSEVESDVIFGKEFFLSFVDTHVVAMIPILQRITEMQAAKLILWLSDNFPKVEDPIFEGAHVVGQRESVGNFRDQILRHLTQQGTKEAIEVMEFIQNEKPELNAKFYLVEARKNFRRSNWEPLNPNDLLVLTTRSNSRVILNSDDLLYLIIDSLKRFEIILQGDNALSSLIWEEVSSKKGKSTPKKEEVLSDFLHHHLKSELKTNGISTYREVQLRKPNYVDNGLPGEKTDIYVSYTHSKTKESFSVIIEVKGSNNESVNTNMEKQLANRYLKIGNTIHGLYLVCWYDCDAYKQQNKTGSKTIAEAKISFENEANRLSKNGKTLKSFVLDCSLRN
ncbi:MAG: hypothetical protein M0R39_02955 [Prolixibacteraceae bacterium]|jgi:hypothetical protein|nr:hypothetical protein [Prolixibacteraceae bacterium]